jgi:DNA transposition AAA+ family ATPase
MQFPTSDQPQQSASSATEAISRNFIETIENDRFIEFCDACRRFRYIGLCYGPPGVGKTLSAFRYSRCEMIVSFDRWTSQSRDQLPINTIFYTTAVINTPSRIGADIGLAREKLMGIARNPIRLEAKKVLDAIRIRDEANRREILNRPGCSPCDPPPVDPTYFNTFELYEARKKAVPDPTTLIIVDEADRLQMNSLEQLRSIFDEGKAGMVLIGMPGIEKRIARFPQFYSRIGFVHEFRVLDAIEIQKLLEQGWTPVGVTLPHEAFLPEVIAMLIRMTGGNFRLLTRILTQVERVLEVNRLFSVSTEVVKAARDSLVIGQG